MNIVPDIPMVFPGVVPDGFVNDVKGWSFDKATLETNAGKLLTLDIDFGEKCSLNCGACFRRNGAVNEIHDPPLTYNETLRVIQQAKSLGLRTVKILGAGEPFEDERFLRFLRDMNRLDLHVSVFTKGHVLASDSLAKHCFGESEGIYTSEDLVKMLAGMRVSILLSCQSFDTELQDSLVGRTGYTPLRNRALKLLCEHGFNQPNPTRLALAMVPLTKSTIGEAADIYRWARERNMYPCTCPSMCSGRARDEAFRSSITPSAEELVEFYAEIYRYNFSKGIQTLDQLRQEGVAAYAGAAPCTQVGCGMYVTSKGIVLRCPGDDVTVFGDVRRDSLANIWRASENFARGGCLNCGCPPKEGKTFPLGFYDEVLARISK